MIWLCACPCRSWPGGPSDLTRPPAIRKSPIGARVVGEGGRMGNAVFAVSVVRIGKIATQNINCNQVQYTKSNTWQDYIHAEDRQ